VGFAAGVPSQKGRLWRRERSMPSVASRGENLRRFRTETVVVGDDVAGRVARGSPFDAFASG